MSILLARETVISFKNNKKMEEYFLLEKDVKVETYKSTYYGRFEKPISDSLKK
jgi:hypothetical protein